MITSKSVIQKIVLDIKFPGEKKHHKDIVLEYDDENLTIGSLHYEDNNSWNGIDIAETDSHYDVHFIGEDDSLAMTKKGEYSDKKAMSIPVHAEFREVVKNEDDDWEGNGNWFYSTDGLTSVRNVRVYTKDGMKRIKIANS